MATPMSEEDSIFEGEDELSSMTTEELIRGARLLENKIRSHKDEVHRTTLDLDGTKEKIKENQEKIKLNKQLPYLVGNIVEILEMNPEEEAEEDGANIDLDSQRKGKCVVLKTSTRQTIFLPVVGLVDPDKLKPGDLVGVNKDSYLILDTLPSEYDSRVKAMEVDEKPTEDYNDIGGLEKQITELVEAIVLPMTHKERFQKLGIRPPKGVLLYGPPGTGKTLMARACAAQTNATFLKLAGPQLVQMFIGDGAKLVRDAFQLAKEKAPCIIFIDEVDAIGTKRFDSEVSGDREVQRTMLELLNQLDGFTQLQQINELSNESKTKQSVKQAFIQQHHPLSQRSVYQQQLKTGSALSVSSPQLLQAASPQVSQQSSPQIDQQSLVASSLQVPKAVTPVQPATSPFMAPSPSALPAPSPHIEDTEKQSSAISSISNVGSAQGFQQTAPALNHAQSLAIGTPGISTSPLLADFSPSPAQNTVNQDGHQTVSSGFLVGDKSSTTEPPLERLVKVINSISPKALRAAVNDIGSVVSLIDRMAGSAPGNGSRAAVGEDLVAMTKCRLQARNLMSQDGSAATKRMRRRMSSMPLSTASSGGSVTNSLQQHNNLESPEMESTATSKIKRPRLEMNHALQDEIREINHQLIDTLVDVSEDDNDAAAAAAVGRDGIVVKCSYNAIALSPSMKNRYRSSQMTPISPLRLLIPENYPNSSPILIDRAPVEPCKEYEDLSSRARSNFHAAVRTLPQPMSLKALAKTWDICARNTVAEYAQQCGGGSFSSRFGAWESCASA